MWLRELIHWTLMACFIDYRGLSIAVTPCHYSIAWILGTDPYEEYFIAWFGLSCTPRVYKLTGKALVGTSCVIITSWSIPVYHWRNCQYEIWLCNDWWRAASQSGGGQHAPSAALDRLRQLWLLMATVCLLLPKLNWYFNIYSSWPCASFLFLLSFLSECSHLSCVDNIQEIDNMDV